MILEAALTVHLMTATTSRPSKNYSAPISRPVATSRPKATPRPTVRPTATKTPTAKPVKHRRHTEDCDAEDFANREDDCGFTEEQNASTTGSFSWFLVLVPLLGLSALLGLIIYIVRRER